MKYTLTEKEEQVIQSYIDDLIAGKKCFDLSYLNVSPYNVRQMLILNDFTCEAIDNNSMEYRWYFSNPKCGDVILDVDADSFEIILKVKEND